MRERDGRERERGERERVRGKRESLERDGEGWRGRRGRGILLSLSLSFPLPSVCSCLSKEVDVSEWRSEFFTDMQRFSCVCATIRCVQVALCVHHVMPQDLINYRV